MKFILLFLAVLAICVLWPSDLSFAQCPEAPNDNGLCDTAYFELYECDWLFAGETKQVRVPIRVTNDIPNPITDSIAGFVIPLCFTTSNPSAQCFLNSNHNYTGMTHIIGCYYWLNPDGSIFRHLPSMEDPQEHNWMMDLCLQDMDLVWGTLFLDLSHPGEFRFSMVNTGPGHPNFCGGSRVLLATMTFTVDDTMTICIDSCFWPPSNRFSFCRFDSPTFPTYIPRSNLPYCFSITYAHAGDCNADCLIDVGDVVYLVSYLFRNSDPPFPLSVGDASCDRIVDVGDAVFLINYLLRGGPAPSC